MLLFSIDLSGRVVVVTGGSRGIGRACVEKFAQAGARVVIGYHERAEEANALVETIRAGGGEAIALAGDLAIPERARELIDAAAREFGSLDVVVHNAGVWRRQPIDTMTEQDLHETLDLNLQAAFALSRHAAIAFGQPGGVLVHIASTAGERGEAHYSHYAASKGALIAMAKSLAHELAPRIRVNVVSPGWVETEMTAAALRGDARREIERSIPLGRVGRPEDVANAVVFLSSDLAAWITGAVLRVNGGGVLAE